MMDVINESPECRVNWNDVARAKKTTSPLTLWITIENHLAGGREWIGL